MTARTKNNKALIFSLIGAFILIIILGRFVLGNLTTISPHDVVITPAKQQDTAVKAPETQKNAVTTQSTDENSGVTSCATNLKNTTEAQKTEYEKGTILIRFGTSVSFADAKNKLSFYGISLKVDANAEKSYSSNQLVTGIVPSGQEFVKICLIKDNPDIKYAGLNVIFSLHE